MKATRCFENSALSERIFDRSVVISDTIAFTCSSAPISCFDPRRGLLYTIYLASRTSYGEQRDIVGLCITPLTQPHRARNLVVVEHGQEVDGVVWRHPFVPTVLFTQAGKVRVTFLCRHIDSHEYDPSATVYYRDYDPGADVLSGIQPVLCRTPDGIEPLTAKVYASHMARRGFKDFVLDGEGEEINNTMRNLYHDGVWYGCLTSRQSYPVIWTSTDDGATVELQGVIPNLTKYECQFTIAKGAMYCLLRGAEGSNYYISHDYGRTFTPAARRVPLWETRPQMLTYHEKVLMAYSLLGIKPNLIRDGRNNMLLVWGEGDDESQYEQLLFMKNPLGMVYYEVINYKDTLYLIYGTSDLFLDLDARKQGKDLLRFSRIGRFDATGSLLC